jgi:cation transport ATPase
MPENASRFFKLDSDADFMAEHPVAYPILVVIGIAVLILPVLVYISIFITVDQGNPDFNVLVLLGLIGAFMIGIGFFNLVAAFLNQYLGHKVTLICILGGLLLCVISLIL